MSDLKVNSIAGSTSTGVHIPGHVVQTVQFLRRGQQDGTSMGSLATLTTSTLTDIMSKAIVTKFANSLIYVQFNVVIYEGTANTIRCKTKILRNSTEINGDVYGGYLAAGVGMINHNVTMIDSPGVAAGTTLTYKMQAGETASGTVGFGYGDSGGGSNASIILMEIAQ